MLVAKMTLLRKLARKGRDIFMKSDTMIEIRK